MNAHTTAKCYQVVKAPSFFNDHIKAQKGFFLGYFEEKPPKDFSPIPVDAFLGDSITKVKIDCKHSEEILKALTRKFIDERYLFPGLDGIVQFMKRALHLS